MGRPRDWSPVRWSTDPTPGNPDEVADLARRFRATAEAVNSAANGLRRIEASQTYHGKGGDKLRERSRDLAGQVAKLHTRYSEAAAALDDYHPEQHAAQVSADAALSRALEAEALRTAAQRTLDSLPRPVAGTPPNPADELARAAAERNRAHGLDQLAKARTAVQAAHERQEAAGTRAANRLRDAIENDGLNDSWKDDALGVVKVIADVAGFIAAVAGILSLFLGWVPILGQILTAVAVLATLVSLLANITLAATGKQGWRAAVMDAVSLATFGIGRVLAASGRLASVAARGRAWNHARTLVSGNSNARYRAVRTMLGGPLRGANRTIADATAGGLARTGLRAAAPGRVLSETVEALRESRGIREAAMTMSGGTWRGVVPGLLGATPEVRALGQIAPEAMAAGDVAHAARVARGLTLASQGVTATGFGLDLAGALPGGGAAVDPAPAGVGSTPSTFPGGFEMPSPHIPPAPPAP